HRRHPAPRQGLLRHHQPAGELVQAPGARLRGADQHRVVGEEPQPAGARAGGARDVDADRAADARSVVQPVSRAGGDAALGARRDRPEDRSRAAGQQEHLQDEPPGAASLADRRAAGQLERGARRARERRPGARDARRASLRTLRDCEARRVARLHQTRLALGDSEVPGRVLISESLSLYQRTRHTSCTMRLVLSPSSCVRRKLSALEPACALLSGVPLYVIAPCGLVNVVVIPSGVPPVDAGLKYGSLNAFRNSPRNSAVARPFSRKRLTRLRSKRTSRGPLTTRLRTPQSP